MLSRLGLHTAGSVVRALKDPLAPGVLHATRIFHTASPRLTPFPPLPELGGKVRHGLIPEEFFEFIYPKTGVTDPYVLGIGLTLFFSLQRNVITADTFAVMSTLGLLIYKVKKYGASVAAFADTLREDQMVEAEGLKQASLQNIQDAIDLPKKQQALAAKRHDLFDVQRSNTAMTLQVFYRERLHEVYTEVKNLTGLSDRKAEHDET